MLCVVQIRLDDPAKYQSIVDAEWNIIYQKLDVIAASGAKIVLSRLAIGDLATQYFADRDIFCAGRVRSETRAPHCLALLFHCSYCASYCRFTCNAMHLNFRAVPEHCSSYLCQKKPFCPRTYKRSHACKSCRRQVTEEDLQRVSQATGAQVQTTVNGLSESALGTCAQFQEKQVSCPREAALPAGARFRLCQCCMCHWYLLLKALSLIQVGGERYNLFTGCPKARTATFVLRGGSEQVGTIAE